MQIRTRKQTNIYIELLSFVDARGTQNIVSSVLWRNHEMIAWYFIFTFFLGHMTESICISKR